MASESMSEPDREDRELVTVDWLADITIGLKHESHRHDPGVIAVHVRTRHGRGSQSRPIHDLKELMNDGRSLDPTIFVTSQDSEEQNLGSHETRFGQIDVVHGKLPTYCHE